MTDLLIALAAMAFGFLTAALLLAMTVLPWALGVAYMFGWLQ